MLSKSGSYPVFWLCSVTWVCNCREIVGNIWGVFFNMLFYWSLVFINWMGWGLLWHVLFALLINNCAGMMKKCPNHMKFVLQRLVWLKREELICVSRLAIYTKAVFTLHNVGSYLGSKVVSIHIDFMITLPVIFWLKVGLWHNWSESTYLDVINGLVSYIGSKMCYVFIYWLICTIS